MICHSCDQPINDGDEVIVTIPMEMVRGELKQSDVEYIAHESCDDEEEEDWMLANPGSSLSEWVHEMVEIGAL